MCLDHERKQIFTLGRYLDGAIRTRENIKVCLTITTISFVYLSSVLFFMGVKCISKIARFCAHIY